MKLTKILEAGHWEVPAIDYPNSLAPTKKRGRLSFLVNPADRGNFFNHSKKRKTSKRLPKGFKFI